MKRRDFVRAIFAASVTARTLAGQQSATPAAPPQAPVAPGPVPWMRGLMEVEPLQMKTLVPDAVAQTNAHFFNNQQEKTQRRLCQVLMPASKTNPGALDAGTPEFLDFLIGASPQDRQQMYRAGFDRLDAEAKHQFGVSFAQVSAAQADKLLRPWLRAWMSDHPPTEPQAHFINVVHSDIRQATMNSQAWNDAAIAAGRRAPDPGLYWYPVDPDLHRDRPATRHNPAPAKGHA